MRHGVKRVKFNRNQGERKALMRSLLLSLFTYEKIVTTEPKAKAVRPMADSLIHKAKTRDVSTRRLLLSYLPNQQIVEKLLAELGPRYSNRTGGYSRIVKLGRRMSDSTPMARIELLDIPTGETSSDEKPLPAKKAGRAIKGEVVMASQAKALSVTPKKSGKDSERLGKTAKEKASVTRRQISTRKAGSK